MFGLLTIVFVGICLAGGGIVLALRSTDPPLHRVHEAVAVPVALLLAWTLSHQVTWLGFVTHAEWRLRTRGVEYARQIARAPERPHAFDLLHGIPDNGVTLINLRGRSPTTLPRNVMFRLLSEPVRECRSIRPNWHVCAYG